MYFNNKVIRQDYRQKERFICLSIPDAGIRIQFTEGNRENPGVYAELVPFLDGDRFKLKLETNDSEVVNINSLYEYFRQKELSIEDQWKENLANEFIAQHNRRIENLAVTERELLESASPTEWMNGPDLAIKAGHDFYGHTKTCLSHLVKLGLLQSNRKKGYRRVVDCGHPYHNPRSP